MKRYIIFLFLLLLQAYHLQAADVPASVTENYHIIKNFQGDRLKVDGNNHYVPLVGEDNSSSPVVGILLDLQQYSGNKLLCMIPKGSSVLVHNQITGYYTKNTFITLDIDSLYQTYKQERILIAAYAPEMITSETNFFIVRPGKGISTGIKNLSEKREKSALEDFFIVGLVILLVSYAFQVNKFPKTFKKLYDFGKVFSLKIREEKVKIRLVNEAHIAFLIHHCLLIGYLLLLLISTQGNLDFSMIIRQPYTFSEFILAWLQLSAYVFLAIWLKYMTVMMFGSLFGLRNFKYIHVFDFMRMSLIVWTILFTAMVLIFSGLTITNPLYINLLVYFFIAFAVIRIVILYYRLFDGTTFRNMYLFSYICTSEIIPLLIGLELFLH